MDSIKFDKRNYRKHNDKNKNLIRKSLEECGAGRSIFIDSENEIIGGNGVYEEAKKLKMPIKMIETDGSELVVVKRTDLKTDDKKRKRLAVMDNSTSDTSEFDYEMLDEDFDVVELEDMGVDFPEEEETQEEEVQEDDFEEPDAEDVAEIETDIQEGDLFILGDHRILCGDSTKYEDVAKLLGGEEVKADMVHTDPPYGVSYKGTNDPTGKEWEIIKNDKLRGDGLFLFLLEMCKNIKKALKKDGAFYMWYATANQLQFENAIRGAELRPKEVIIWDKGMTLGRSDYHWAYEPCFYGCHNDKNCRWYGDRTQQTFWKYNRTDLNQMKKEELLDILKNLQDNRTCWRIKRDNVREYIHPTQKPVAIPAKAIRNSSRRGAVVLDLFGGSGSTMIACEQLKRKARLMELDPKYVHVEICRFIKFTGKDVYRIRDGKQELYTVPEEEILGLAANDKGESK